MDEYSIMVRNSAADAVSIARSRAAGRRRPRRGAFALLLVIIVIGAAFILGMGYLTSATVRLAGSNNYVALARAKAAADSAMEHALYVLRSAPQTASGITTASPAGPYVLDGNVVYRFYFAAGSGTNELYTPVGIGGCGAITQSLSATIRVHNTTADTIMAGSPEAYWRLGETSGTFARDQTGAHSGWYMNGVSLGNASPLIGATAASAHFDGSNDYVDVGYFDLSESALTIAAWVKADAGDLNNRCVIGQGGELWTLGTVTSSGRFAAYFRLKAKNDTQMSGGTVTAGQWTFLVGVYNGANVILYQDGVEVARASNYKDIRIGKWGVWIGGKPNGDARNRWLGYIAEVLVSQTALSPAQVQALYQARYPQLTILNWNE